MKDKRYACRNVRLAGMPKADDPVWEQAPAASFLETGTGASPFLATEMRLLRDDDAQRLYVRFLGEDDEVLSRFRLHDAPIYREDVLELFIADTNDLARYKELECSPYDVHFDGTIEILADGGRALDMDYDIPGWVSRSHMEGSRLTSVWALPYAAFDVPPASGVSWRFNAFRVDHHSARGASFQAWQPTMSSTFHVPQAFGRLDFVD